MTTEHSAALARAINWLQSQCTQLNVDLMFLEKLALDPSYEITESDSERINKFATEIGRMSKKTNELTKNIKKRDKR